MSNINLIHALVSQLHENTSLGVQRWWRRQRPDQNHNIPEISNVGDMISPRQSSQTNPGKQTESLIRKHSPKTDKFSNT